jgi:hypothetical protein
VQWKTKRKHLPRKRKQRHKKKQKHLPRINTELHGNKTKNKQKHLPRTNTELHGNKQKHLPRINTELHGNKQKQKLATEGSRSICHGLTRNFTEGSRSRNLDTEKKPIFQSRMRKRRYKYIIWKGPLRQAQGPGFLRYGQ